MAAEQSGRVLVAMRCSFAPAGAGAEKRNMGETPMPLELLLFVDQADIQVSAGDGGRGCVSMRKEKYIPQGGPDGGDGGDGGSVYMEAAEGVDTLLDLVGRHHWHARAGGDGEGKKKAGKDGLDLVIRVPPGTLVYDNTSGLLLVDLKEKGQRACEWRGGKRRKGKRAFCELGAAGAGFCRTGTEGADAGIAFGIAADCGCGVDRIAQCGEVDVAVAVHSCKAEDCRLSVHDAFAAAWHRGTGCGAAAGDRRHSRVDRRGERRSGPGVGFSPAH